eukprot:TRINITY_DN4029_c1_g1_i1.p1 TRINITY_DN4029_c1_g1~~TRINITY_DN4029_c1_g1_i1.p1  ORF type:complete len:317 (-),score=36.85 TRINITY_DN4029_c1_g1_i1:44-994(-)
MSSARGKNGKGSGRETIAQQRMFMNYFKGVPASSPSTATSGGMDPFPLTDLPLELIALISDFVHNFADLGNMSLVSCRVRSGVLLSRQWIVVEEIVASTSISDRRPPIRKVLQLSTAEYTRRVLYNRRLTVFQVCKYGLLRALRPLNLSRSEVAEDAFELVRYVCEDGQLEILRYLHTKFALTTEELSASEYPPEFDQTPMRRAVRNGHHEVVRYLRAVAGVRVTGGMPYVYLNLACEGGHLEMLKYLHTECGFTADDVYLLDLKPYLLAVTCGNRSCVHYLRTAFGLTKDDARRAHDMCTNLNKAEGCLLRSLSV